MPNESFLFTYAQKQKRKRAIFGFFLCLVAVLLFLQLLLHFVIYPTVITSNSMEPDFRKNSTFFVTPQINNSPLFFHNATLHRGSLVTVNNDSIMKKTNFQNIVDFIVGTITIQKFKPFESERWGDTEVYRVVGLPGDTLYIENYVAHIRQGGASHFLTEFELSDIEYDILSTNFPDNWNMWLGAQGKTEQISLKRDEYYLMSDNRVVATDSRIFGPVAEENINGKVALQYFPLSSIRALP